MEHEEFRLKLAAYLDNAVSAEEKEEIRKHLAMCGRCRGEIADLELTVSHLKTLPEVDPPSWLADKIMAKVEEEGGQRSTLWKWLFFPLHVKLPIEALAVLFICVTGFFLTRMINEETPITAKPSAPPALTKARPPSHEESEVRSVSALPKTKVDIQRRLMDNHPKMEEKNQVPSLSVNPNPQESTVTQEKALPNRKMIEPELQWTGNEYFTEKETRSAVKEEKGAAESKGGKKGKSLAGGEDSAGSVLQRAGNVEITIIVDDPALASGKIENAVTSIGGRINGRSYGGATNQLIIRIGADKVARLVDRLSRIGAVKRYPQLSPDAGGTIDMIIRW